MAWPNPNEYVEAIQHPQQAFADSDLRGGSVVTNRLGLPRPVSGNFATVFELASGEHRWAVRCFLREVTNQQDRYAAIAAHLKEYALPCMVNFEYLREGILVRGKWYPILKMDWTVGIRLDTYIEQNLNNPPRLRQLAERWINLCRSLRQAQIAHGDLQHGNILVNDQHEIKLIDYDGMIVPDVIGLANHEIGHRHYQHPTRTSDDGITLDNLENVDNFSCHVIGLSLLALSVDGSLWGRTQAGEENLLFRDTDYKSPETSDTFDLLDTHEDQRVRVVAQVMLDAIHAPTYFDVPAFTHNPLDNRWGWVKSWLMNRVATPEETESLASEAVPRDSWVFDHVEAPKPALLDFTDDFILHERIAVEVAFENSVFVTIPRLFLPFAVAQLLIRYRGYPLVVEKAHAQQVSRSLEKQLADAKARRKTLSRLIVEADRRYQQEVRTLEIAVLRLKGDLDYSHRQETREVMRLERTVQNLTHELAQQRLEPGKVAEIDAEQIDALAQVGVRTAAEIDAAHEAAALHALHAASAAPRDAWESLLAWRRRIEQQVSAMPISPDDVQTVRQRHADAQQDLDQQYRQTARQLADAQSSSEHLKLAQNLRAELNAAELQVTALQTQYSRALDHLARYQYISLRRFFSKMLDWSPLR